MGRCIQPTMRRTKTAKTSTDPQTRLHIFRCHQKARSWRCLSTAGLRVSPDFVRQADLRRPHHCKFYPLTSSRGPGPFRVASSHLQSVSTTWRAFFGGTLQFISLRINMAPQKAFNCPYGLRPPTSFKRSSPFPGRGGAAFSPPVLLQRDRPFGP